MNWKFLSKKNSNTPKPKKSKTREWVDAIVFAVVAATIIRGLLFSAYAIPSGSMEGTELTGDYLFVSKCSYGPRMPFTPVSIPFTEPHIGILANMKSYWEGIQWPYMRIPGFTHVKKGDIVVFNKPEENGTPIDMRTTLIKRCQATPGDTLSIVNAQVYINGKAAPNAPKAQTSYAVTFNTQNFNQQVLDDLNIEQFGPIGNNAEEMIIPADNLSTFKSYSFVKSVTPVIAPKGNYEPKIFPHNPKFMWNLDNFGPLVLPKKGMTIPLNDSTVILYSRAIEVYEGNRLGRAGTAYTLNGKPAATYTFKMGYYWMMGDNRHNSLDCRFWGYVPEDHIIGKAVITWFSVDPNKNIFTGIRWNRILRPID
jgi:signal peptidase I